VALRRHAPRSPASRAPVIAMSSRVSQPTSRRTRSASRPLVAHLGSVRSAVIGEGVISASASVSVPLIRRVLNQILPASLPRWLPEDADGARFLGRYVGCARSSGEFQVCIHRAIYHPRLPKIFMTFATSDGTMAFDLDSWRYALGESARPLHEEFGRSHRRGSYLLEGLVRMLSHLGFPSIDPIAPIHGPSDLTRIPELKKATEDLFRLFVCAIAIGECTRRRKPSAVGHEIATCIVDSTHSLESFVFALASGISAAVHAPNDPELETIRSWPRYSRTRRYFTTW
jgi:hypothetical protein